MEKQVRRRRRPALSCISCRSRKIKCDRANPCANCVKAKAPCDYQAFSESPGTQQHVRPGRLRHSRSSPPEQTPSPLSPVQGTSTGRPSANYGSHPIGTHVRAAIATKQHEAPSIIGRTGIQSHSVQDTEKALQDLLQRIQRLEESAVRTTAEDTLRTARGESASGLRMQDSYVTLNKTRVLRWSLWMGNAPEFAPLLDIYTKALSCGEDSSFQHTEMEALVIQIGELLQKCKTIARALKLGRPSRCLSSPKSGLVVPARDVADRMVALYFQSFESTHRILHIPSFWKDYERFWQNPDNVTMDLRLKVLLVVGIGSSLHEDEGADSELRNIVHRWIYAAQTWLSGPLEKDRLNIAGLQIYCLTILAREIFSMGGDLVWMSMGSLVHRAMQMGLHRDPKYLQGMPVLQAELRRRLWTTILEMLVQSSLDSALPPRISLSDFDTEAPANVNDFEMEESTSALSPHPREVHTSASIQLALLDSLSARLRIVQLLNGLRAELSYSDVLALSSEIIDACREQKKLIGVNETTGVTPLHRNLLDYLVRRFVIPLHCPFASKARTKPEFYYSLKVSLDAAMAILSPEPDQGYARLMAIGGGLFREGIRCAGTVVGLELISHVETQRFDGVLQRSPQYRDLLKQFLENLLSLSTERIQQGETNIKMHTFVCMILAQVEAMEAGTSCEHKVAQAAKESLEFCHDLLQTRAAAVLSPRPNDSVMLGPEQDYGLDFSLDFFFAEESFP